MGVEEATFLPVQLISRFVEFRVEKEFEVQIESRFEPEKEKEKFSWSQFAQNHAHDELARLS